MFTTEIDLGELLVPLDYHGDQVRVDIDGSTVLAAHARRLRR
jgi:hypothetical protein